MSSEHASSSTRVILDVNIYLSYLLDPANPNRTITRIMDRLFSGYFRLVIPAELIDELTLAARRKPYFRERLTERDVRNLMSLLQAKADAPPRLSDIPGVVRDPKDDYLIAHAILGRVDFLVTGDRDLLALDGEVDPMRIVTAAEFLRMVEPESGEP